MVDQERIRVLIENLSDRDLAMLNEQEKEDLKYLMRAERKFNVSVSLVSESLSDDMKSKLAHACSIEAQLKIYQHVCTTVKILQLGAGQSKS